MLAHEVGPHSHVSILDFRETAIQVALLGVGLGIRQEPVQVGGVRFVLPVMGEGVEVGSMGHI
jgi:hypothetical protein